MRVDVAVVGAGALGLSTALHCALRGRSVVVLDRREPGSQASGRAAGLFKSVQGDELRTALARRSIELARDFADWAGVPLPVVATGSLLVARSPGHQDLLAAEAAQSRAWGVALETVSPAEAAARSAGSYVPGGDEQVVWCPEDLYVEEPGSLVAAYLAACQRLGVPVLAGEAVTAVLAAGGQVRGLRTSEREVTAPVVVDAAGAWVRQVGELAGATVAAAPVRHQLLITEPDPGISAAAPIIRVLDHAVYLRPARGGLMLGGFEASPLPVDPRAQPPGFDTDDLPLDPGVLHEMAAQVADLVPAAAQLADGLPWSRRMAGGSGGLSPRVSAGEAGPAGGGLPPSRRMAGGSGGSSPRANTVAEHRGGMFTMSPDGRFLAGPVPEIPGFWILSGCNGSGFSSSPALGEALADWITTGRAPAGLEALAPSRFPTLPDDVLVQRGTWQYAHYYSPVSAS